MKLYSTIFIAGLLVAFSCADRMSTLQTLETTVDTKTINFEHEKFSNALSEAKESNKPILTYVGSPFCKRCKQMEKEVFPDTVVSSFVNTNFVCVKFYLSKDEYSAKSKEYKMQNRSLLDFMDINDCKISFPTFVILDSSGELLNKHTGSLTSKEFVAFTKNSIPQQ